MLRGIFLVFFCLFVVSHPLLPSRAKSWLLIYILHIYIGWLVNNLIVELEGWVGGDFGGLFLKLFFLLEVSFWTFQYGATAFCPYGAVSWC